MKLDRIDVGILQAIKRDAHAKAVDLAEALGISPSPLYRRIRLLEQAGVITNYATLLSQEKVGLPVSAYVSVALEKSAEKLAAFERAILGCEEVIECYLMTGVFDYIVRVVASAMPAFLHFLLPPPPPP